MLPIYKAIAINKEALLGGSTLPCLMMVADEEYNSLASYVVKIFKHRNIEQYQPTNKEVYASILAQHFDLCTPKPALIVVDEYLIHKLKLLPQYQKIDIRQGVYFGCEYQENASGFKDLILKKEIAFWQLSNVFAFDILIRNTDRRIGKPNLFYKHDDIYLIDHELSLNIAHPFNWYVQNNQWKDISKNNKGEQEHIFLRSLKENRLELSFDDFIEYLKHLNPNLLDSYAIQLEELNQKIVDFHLIKAYLTEAKRNHQLFHKILYNLLDD